MKPLRRAPLVSLALCALLETLSSCAFEAPKITSPRYALVYGIAKYPISSLNYTVEDANDIAATLADQNWSVQESTDDAVIKSKIKSDILALSTVSANSTILVYFSGHGTYVDASWNSGAEKHPYYPSYSGGYICPYDSIGGSGYIEASTVANLISPAELESWLGAAGTKNVIVILDNCYSGAFVSSTGATDASPQNYSLMPWYSAFATAMFDFGDLLAANASATGAKTPIVLSGAGSRESNYDGSDDMGHGVFTYFLLKAATDGDSDGDGVVTTTEAYAYTEKRIKEWDASLITANNGHVWPFLPHISGDTRDLVLFTK